jgi:2-hydroxy-6-oxonona-2,4-dienedioate hydrolase
MPRIVISGIEIAYELLGPAGAPAVALTPGGRFPMDSPGLAELGQTLAAGGKRVLLWDRPNCGASDLYFDAENESELHAHTLTQLIRALDLGPTALAAGSAGSRVSLIAASRDPDAISHLVLWWISGGVLSLMQLAAYYCADSAMLASQRGMKAVAKSPAWSLQIERNPRNRDILMALTPEQYIATMERWASFYVPSQTSPVPGMTPADFARLGMPVLILRNGRSDLSHTRRTSDWVHELVPHSLMREAPWPDDEWNNRMMAVMEGRARGLFEGWPMLATDILQFTHR